ncbi:DNA mismatch repair protein MutT [candidate division KSB3 bacterium]|uniref:DNA mismatch repair protein MutT n=1 Tax=candidate division KSB3 bacterium TaxID=2044937 RepID=A0A2G6KID1_9BACT|nr:MAG: DNA mismatch repair protein MutT [candidate division KSB3 bacterium]
MRIGKDYIGVGVGAIVLNDEGKVFLAQRGPQAVNERGCWEFPGGRVEFGEKLGDAIQREFLEKYGMEIEVSELFSVSDHLLPDEEQHWVSPTFLARHVGGEPTIREPKKCTAIGWFSFSEVPAPLSVISQDDLHAYLEKYGLEEDM